MVCAGQAELGRRGPGLRQNSRSDVADVCSLRLCRQHSLQTTRFTLPVASEPGQPDLCVHNSFIHPKTHHGELTPPRNAQRCAGCVQEPEQKASTVTCGTTLFKAAATPWAAELSHAVRSRYQARPASRSSSRLAPAVNLEQGRHLALLQQQVAQLGEGFSAGSCPAAGQGCRMLLPTSHHLLRLGAQLWAPWTPWKDVRGLDRVQDVGARLRSALLQGGSTAVQDLTRLTQCGRVSRQGLRSQARVYGICTRQ